MRDDERWLASSRPPARLHDANGVAETAKTTNKLKSRVVDQLEQPVDPLH